MLSSRRGQVHAGLCVLLAVLVSAAVLMLACASAQAYNPTHTNVPAISCPSAHGCFVVGQTGAEEGPITDPAFSERWNGSKWEMLTTPQVRNWGTSLTDVSCTSWTWCMAVGATNQGGIPVGATATWDGARWTYRHIPARYNWLKSVSCSSVNVCTAVGQEESSGGVAAILRWNGRAWRRQEAPYTGWRADLSAVSCPRRDFCMAVGAAGSDYHFSAFRWDGRKWRDTNPPIKFQFGQPEVSSVSCTSPSACTLAGNGGTADDPYLVGRWNGRRWHKQKLPRAGFAPSAVSCANATTCVLVGRSATTTIIEHWNGTTWTSRDTGYYTTDQSGEYFNDVSCSSAGACMAIGGYYPHLDSYPRSVSLQWNGSQWKYYPAF